MKTQTNTTPTIESEQGFRGMLRKLIGGAARVAPRTGPALIHVWDVGRNAYRQVSLDDRNDPLWPAARSLARMQAA